MAKSKKPPCWSSRKVALRRGDGEIYHYLTLNCLGEWTYHRALKNFYLEEFSKDTWSVMHIPSGAVAVSCVSEEDARNCVAVLGSDWSSLGKSLPKEPAKKNELFLALQAAREQGKMLFYFTHEDRDTVMRFQEDQWERELVAALG